VHGPASPAKMPAAYCCAPALSASNLRARTATYLGRRMVSSTESATRRPSRGFKSAMKEEEKPGRHQNNHRRRPKLTGVNRGFWHGAAVHRCVPTRGARPQATAHPVGTRGARAKPEFG